MSANLFIYLDFCPSLDDMRQSLATLGLSYRHTLPADSRWDYPMHVFGCDDLRVVYHQGNPEHGEAIVDSSIVGARPGAEVRLQVLLAAIVHRYGGLIYDPGQGRRGGLVATAR